MYSFKNSLYSARSYTPRKTSRIFPFCSRRNKARFAVSDDIITMKSEVTNTVPNGFDSILFLSNSRKTLVSYNHLVGKIVHFSRRDCNNNFRLPANLV